MVKQRLIFTLLWDHDAYQLSRNFRLQRVGDMSWLRGHYDFDAISFSIDELVLLNVSRTHRSPEELVAPLKELSALCFIPVAAGGGIRSIEDAQLLLRAGADKLVLNTPIVTDPKLVSSLVDRYGSQCVVASIDYSLKGGKEQVFIRNGSEATGDTIEQAIERAENLGAGEIYLTSIDKDGTGQGLDLATIERIGKHAKAPLIASGGAGQFDHLADAVAVAGASAVSTANLFNFMANGLTEARTVMRERGIPLAEWENRREI